METSPLLFMTKSFLLEDLPEENLDQILSLPPKGKGQYFSRLIKNFYPDHSEDSEEYSRLIEAYVASFYLEKLYRSNRFFNESFTPIYTNTGLIRNIWADIFFTDDDLITH